MKFDPVVPNRTPSMETLPSGRTNLISLENSDEKPRIPIKNYGIIAKIAMKRKQEKGAELE